MTIRTDSAAGPLAAFLRARREQVRPEQLGMVSGDDRQVTGLRRDEVAVLAGISTDYYIRLEQGRERRPSRHVIEGLADALLLDEAAVRYLRELTEADQAQPAPAPGVSSDRLTGLVQLVDSWDRTPALIVNRWLDIVAWNTLGDILYEGLAHRENYARMVFLSPKAADFFLDWPEFAHCTVASLRANAGSETDAANLVQLVGELTLKSGEFSASWARHDLYEQTVSRKRFGHPLVGAVEFEQHVLAIPGSGGYQVWAYHPVAEGDSREKLGKLGDLASFKKSGQRRPERAGRDQGAGRDRDRVAEAAPGRSGAPNRPGGSSGQ
ncbi:helix-turn-helix transcriptional regulator [Streptomyces sp. NPDC051569]|uniref:helix-turn-helix transcriptional regulator n=1 Tax=Streptomyces sp. NPDC051569 TaxID=3365661 RepID=UPI0037A88432